MFYLNLIGNFFTPDWIVGGKSAPEKRPKKIEQNRDRLTDSIGCIPRVACIFVCVQIECNEIAVWSCGYNDYFSDFALVNW